MELNGRLDYFVGESVLQTGSAVGLYEEHTSWIFVAFLFLILLKQKCLEWYHEDSWKTIGSIWIVHLNAHDVNVPICIFIL